MTNRDAIVWTRKLLDEEGLFAGVSSGAIASIAVRIANEMDEGNIVFIVCDDGWKYLCQRDLHAAGRRGREPRLNRLVVTDVRNDMPFNVGGPELIIILAIALIVLGPRRLPDAGKALGNGMREFKDSIKGMDPRDDVDEVVASTRTKTE